ncbi:conserved hypothetical protein [Clostridium neonatale]|uniref:hypothetical protein n=1 Tax=Clostridium neonatale TaxID=137838 RepID=UPI00291B954F|nr:hypothetical protein [Clostridium neonatale]CAI3586339.1 conserved hypothetical protein [Clostridium neonatale]
MGRIIQAIYNIVDRKQAEKIQHKIQKEREPGNSKSFMELIEEELRKELSIEPIERNRE